MMLQNQIKTWSNFREMYSRDMRLCHFSEFCGICLHFTVCCDLFFHSKEIFTFAPNFVFFSLTRAWPYFMDFRPYQSCGPLAVRVGEADGCSLLRHRCKWRRKVRRGSIEVSSGAVAKNVSASAGDTRNANSIPGSRRSPRVGNGNLLQYTCLKIFTDRDAGWVMVYGVSKSWVASSSKQRMLAKSGDFQSFLITMTMSVSQSVQSLSRVRLFATPWIAARRASLSTTKSRSLLRLMPIESVMPSSHLILSSCSPPAPNPSKHQGLFKWVNSLHEVTKVLEFQLQHQSFQGTPRTDLL